MLKFIYFYNQNTPPPRLLYEIFLSLTSGYSQNDFFTLTIVLIIRKLAYVIENAEIG